MPIGPEDIGELSGELSSLRELPPRELPAVGRERLTRGRRILRIVTSFFVGQGAAQGITVLAALFLVRHLSVEAYAQFGLATGFQTVFVALMDFGIASTIVPMVGERREDRALVGRYVRSAKHLRDRAFWVLAPVAALTFLAVMHKQHWSWSVQLLLLASVLLALYSGGQVSYYSTPLLIFGRLRDYYLPQVISGAGRLAAYVGLAFAGGLNAWAAAGLGALNVTINGSWYAKKSRPLLQWPDREDPATDRELVRYILPAAPAMILAAFQAQLTLFLISIFGGSTLYIAQVAALSKIGQLFSVLMMFNMVIIEPYMARLNRQRLLPTFLGLIFLATLLCIPVVLAAFTWPQAFLWLIGSKYKGLTGVLGWVILSACMNYVAGLMWIMNRARKWVFWSGTILEITLLVVVQIAFVVFVGVRNTREAVLLSLAASCCYLVAHIYGAIYGFFKGPRVVHPAEV